MRLDDLRQELEAMAADTPAPAGDGRAVVRSGVRRFWLRRGIAGAVVLAVFLGAAVWVGHLHDDHYELSVTAGSGASTSTPNGLTAATIADGDWSTIRGSRSRRDPQGTAIWTGSQLIVWGGENGAKVFGDGAAYDPRADKWRVLPPAPVPGAASAAAVWTGHEMIVWGGARNSPGHYTNDGAAFDPAAWTWRRIAPSPLAPRAGAHMLWTGSEVITVGGSESSRDATTVLDAANYDPAADRWHRIDPLPGIPGAVFEDVRPVWTGRKLLAWELYTHTAGTLTTVRTQLVEFDPKTGKWARGPATDDPHRNVFAPIWTGRDVVAFAEPPLCDLPDGAQNCGPPPTNVHGSVFDPTTGVWRSMPQGSADVGADAGVWTGADVVVLSGGLNDPTSGNTIVEPGTAAAWDPETNTWTPIPRAPFGPDVEATVWTGRELLVWGSVTDNHTGSLASQGVRYASAP